MQEMLTDHQYRAFHWNQKRDVFIAPVAWMLLIGFLSRWNIFVVSWRRWKVTWPILHLTGTTFLLLLPRCYLIGCFGSGFILVNIYVCRSVTPLDLCILDSLLQQHMLLAYLVGFISIFRYRSICKAQSKARRCDSITPETITRWQG